MVRGGTFSSHFFFRGIFSFLFLVILCLRLNIARYTGVVAEAQYSVDEIIHMLPSVEIFVKFDA